MMWTLEEDNQLTWMFREGYTIKVISQKISTNRAEAGIRSRLEKLGLKRERPRPPNWRKPVGELKNAKPPLVIKEAIAPFKTLDISIMELNNTTCRAMTGKATYCGHNRAEHSKSYCGWHHDRYYARSIKGDYNVG